jgi:hypothetical protein
MIATIRDSELLRSMRPVDVQMYLRAKGWTPRESSSDFGSAWLLRRPGEKLSEVLVPKTVEIDDYVNRMSDILSDLERVEGRPQTQLLADITNVLADVVRVRSANDDTADGTIPLPDGARLIQAVRDLILDAASSAKEPRPIYASQRSEEAKAFVEHSRLGQSEVGSYIITIITRLTEPTELPLFSGVTIDPPFERRVSLTLSDALDTLTRGSERALMTGDLGLLTTSHDHGVSANLCEAIVEMSGPQKRPIDISFAWSPVIAVPLETVNHVSIRSEHIKIIDAVAHKIRESVALEDFQLNGMVTKLARGMTEKSGAIVIHGIIDEKLRKVTVLLVEGDYDNATTAHRDHSLVQCVGSLRKVGRVYVLDKPRGFMVVPKSLGTNSSDGSESMPLFYPPSSVEDDG